MYIPPLGSLLPSVILSSLFPPYSTLPRPQCSSSKGSLTFRPTHAHATSVHRTSDVLFTTSHNDNFQPSSLSVASDPNFLDTPLPHIAAMPLTLNTRRQIVRRPINSSRDRLSEYRRRSMLLAQSAKEEWEDVEIDVPDVTDRQTLITLAKMASNAYVAPDTDEWWPLDEYNHTQPFGWEPDADGLRGHVFADDTNSTVVIAIKGTSAGVLGVGGPTAKNDKFNDNLLFSCCCARVDFSWSTVCDCYGGGYKCDQTCIEKALIEESVYASVGSNLYNNVTYMYPNANIWLTGHSLGGSLSSLIGLSFGSPAVTFEAVGDLLPAQRLHLPLPPGMPSDKTAITHVYHNADPVPMGVCTGAYSACYAGGFALESKCHTGKTILYDTVNRKGWAVDLRTHRIGELINKVLNEPWPEDDDEDVPAGEPETISAWWGWGRKGPKSQKPGDGDGDKDDPHGGVPKAEAEEDCVDCFRWEFSND